MERRPTKETVTFDPSVFATPDIDTAKRIILTPSADMGVDERWSIETPYFAELLGGALNLQAGQLVIDYGCGLGRISKVLIERFGCVVLGVDSSEEMRALAPPYVGSAAFSVVSRRTLEAMAHRGLRADAAICVWVLQHCIRPGEDIRLISRVLREGAPVGVVNTLRRALPATKIGWYDDGIDIRDLLSNSWTVTDNGELDATKVGANTAQNAFFGLYRR